MTAATLDLRRPLVVVTGLFNPAIFNPQWCANHLFGVPPGETINIALAEGVGAGVGTVFIKGVGWSVNQVRLELYAADAEEGTFDRLEQALLNIFEVLPHTPFGAFGVNFGVTQAEVSDLIADTFNTAEEIEANFKVLSRSFKHTLEYDGEFKINVEKVLDDTGFFLAINYHLEDIDVENVKRVAPGALKKFLNEAKEYVGKFYGINELIIEKIPLPEM